jgi:hypothetical protein
MLDSIKYENEVNPRSLSSAGRAPPLQGGGHWFEPSSDHHIYFNSFLVLQDIPGRLAQLGEHLPYKEGVTGSSPVATTISLCLSVYSTLYPRSLSSAGRAPPLQGGGHWFEPSSDHHFSVSSHPNKFRYCHFCKYSLFLLYI